MVSAWPGWKDAWNFAAEEAATETIKEAVRSIRAVRTSMNVPPSKKTKVFVVSENTELLQIFEHSKAFFASLGNASQVLIQPDKAGIDEDAVSALIPQAAIYLPFAELVDIEKPTDDERAERAVLFTEFRQLSGDLSREAKNAFEEIEDRRKKNDKIYS